MSKVYMKLGELPFDPAEIEIEVGYLTDDGKIDVDTIRLFGNDVLDNLMQETRFRERNKARVAIENAVLAHLIAEGEASEYEQWCDARAANEFYERKAE